MPSLKLLKEKIIAGITQVVSSANFKSWLEEETIPKSGNPFIAINNSFIFREDIKTIKNEKYLAFKVSEEKKLDLKNIFIIEGIGFNSHFKIFIQSPKYKITSLSEAIKLELKNIGRIIYALVGEIKDIHDISEEIKNSTFKKLTLSPTLESDFIVEGDEIKIKDYTDRGSVWEKIKKHCDDNSIAIPTNLPLLINEAISSLQKNAYSTLHFPKSFDPNKKYLLDSISMVVKKHLDSYKNYLSKIDTDSNAMIEILRISYNFVSDINKLLILTINLCDLKPLILWLTIYNHIYLDERFKNLPFGFSKPKTSLTNYAGLIRNARNKSFHQLFPFNKSIKFELEALNNVTVTIFTTYGTKNPKTMTYEDQKLNELLQTFTRVNEEILSKEFWTKNEVLIEAVYNLLIETSDSIKATI